MMNQVENPYSKISNRNFPYDFIKKTTPQTTEPTAVENKSEEKVGNLKGLTSDIFITPDEARKKNNSRLLGTSIALATLLTASLVFLFFGSGAKGIVSGVNKLQNFLLNKTQRYKLKNNGIITFATGITATSAAILAKIANRFEFVNNFTSFKDSLFKIIMNNKLTGKLTGPVHESITKLFERIARSTVVKSYRNTSEKLFNANGSANYMRYSSLKSAPETSITINGTTMPKDKWIRQAKALEDEMMSEFNEAFGETAQKSRYNQYRKILKALSDKFLNLRETFFTKNVYKNFIAEYNFSEDRAKILNEVIANRRRISYSPKDITKSTEDLITKILTHLKFNDTDKFAIINSIKANLEQYCKTGSAELKAKILEDLKILKEDILLTSEQASPHRKKGYEEALSCIDTIIKNFNEYYEGKLERVLKIYEKILPKAEFEKIKAQYSDVIENLDKSIKIENEEFSSKLRDFSIGSAPTDILSIFGGLGVLGYELGKSESKKERLSISLKYGIPALIGFGTAFYGNAKLFAGSKSMIFALACSGIANRIGKFVDDKLQEYYAKKAKDTSKNG